MTYEQAKEILDQVRQGQGHSISSSAIRIALWHTGDLGFHEAKRGEGVDEEIPPEDWRARCRARAIMVGRSKR